MIVVDTNIITYLVLKGDHSEACCELLLRDSEWAAPRLWRDELCNVLATYERRGLLSRTLCLRAFADAERVMGHNQFDLRPERILLAAARTGCSGYDAQCIALAEDLNCRLYTCDKQILRAVPDLSRRPEE